MSAVFSTRGLSYIGALLAFVSLSASAGAQQPAPLDVHGDLDGQLIGRHVSVLDDPKGELSFDDVRTPEVAKRFAPSTSDAPNFGFSSSTYWLRFDVRNPAKRTGAWMLELAYPHLDELTLYEPRPDGSFRRVDTGDSLPFSQRDLDYREFVFELEEPASSLQTYYLRVRSTGAVNVPLAAWSPRAFLAGQQSEWAALWMFYGILLIMAFYNGCIYVLVRQVEFLNYTLFALSLVFLQFTFAGHTFRFLVPNAPWLANRLLPFSIALLVVAGSHFADNYLGRRTLHGTLRAFQTAALVLAVASFLLPYDTVIVLLIPVAFCTATIGIFAALVHALQGDRRGILYVVAWLSFLGGAVAVMLRAEGLLPVNFFTTWGMQIGAVVQLALLSTVLADKINSMRADLAVLNEQLSERVTALREALARAEDATARAEQATRVKDEFMATMSHEFRTPLNAIINIPQGLLTYFPEFEMATCFACHSEFELEAGDVVDAETACPECGAVGQLRCSHGRRYQGNAEHTASYLSKIERSGSHLLQLVNGILDFSKIEAGQFRLSVETLKVQQVVADAIDQVSAVAEERRVNLEVVPCDSEATLQADGLRVRQVLINLIANAIKFSDAGSRVTVRCEALVDCYRFSVQDRGIGIARNKVEAVFASFEQVHKGNTRKYGGTGLGLSIARSLVRMHGGDMWVESQLGEGSTFFFDLPLRAVSTRPPAQSSSTPTPDNDAEASASHAVLQENRA